MIKLFPELPKIFAQPLAENLRSKSVVQLEAISSIQDERIRFRETGGNRVTERELSTIFEEIAALAVSSGYPNPPGRRNAIRFDALVSRYLHMNVALTPTQGCREDVWSYFGCVLLPSIVRWRWGGETTPAERFVGRDRGLRHTFGRCWWRAELLYDESSPADPYHLLAKLGEDELVGFVERSGAVTSRRTAVALAKAVISCAEEGLPVARYELFRDVMKRFLRLGSIVSYECLSVAELDHCLKSLVFESKIRLASRQVISTP